MSGRRIGGDARAPMSTMKPTALLGELGVAPVADRRLRAGLVGIGSRGLVLCAADDDPVVGFADNAQQHVGVLVLRRLDRLPLGSVLAETWKGSARIPRSTCARMLCEKAGSTSSRTSRASRSDHISQTVSSPARITRRRCRPRPYRPLGLGLPFLARAWRLERDRVALAGVGIGVAHDLARRRIVGHVVDARPNVDDGCERRMRGHVADALAVDPNLAPSPDGLSVLVSPSGSPRSSRLRASCPTKRAACSESG